MTAKIVAGALYAALLAIAALAYADEGHGFPEPNGFRDVPWGASEETLRFRIRTQSCDVVDATVDFGTRRCVATGNVTFGHVDFVGGAVQDTLVAVTKAELMTREAERRDRARRAANR